MRVCFIVTGKIHCCRIYRCNNISYWLARCLTPTNSSTLPALQQSRTHPRSLLLHHHLLLLLPPPLPFPPPPPFLPLSLAIAPRPSQISPSTRAHMHRGSPKSYTLDPNLAQWSSKNSTSATASVSFSKRSTAAPSAHSRYLPATLNPQPSTLNPQPPSPNPH